MKLDVTGLTPLDTSGLSEVSPSNLDVSGLTELDTSGLRELDAESFLDEPQEDSWLDVGKKVAQNAPTMLKQAGAGMLQMLAESPPSRPIGMEDPFADAEHAERIDKLRAADAVPGQQAYREAEQDLKANAPHVDPESLKGYAYDISQGLIQLAPSVAATLATRRPIVGAGIIGSQVGGQRYGESREAGRDPNQAIMDSAFYSASEGIPEAIPLGFVIKRGEKFLPRTLKTAAAESVQEMFTQILQTGYDMGILDEEMTWDQAINAIKRAGIVGAGSGAGIGAAAHPFVSAAEREEDAAIAANKAKAEPEEPKSEAEVELFRVTRSYELKKKGKLSAVGQRELDFLQQNKGNPAAVAHAYDVTIKPAEPAARDDNAIRPDLPAPTQGDIESPIPTGLIQEGKALIEDALAGKPAPTIPAPELTLDAAPELDTTGLSPLGEMALSPAAPTPAVTLAAPPAIIEPEPELVDEADQIERTRANIAGETTERGSLIVLRDMIEAGTDVMNDGQFPAEINEQAMALSQRIDAALDADEGLPAVQQEAVESIREWLKRGDIDAAEAKELAAIQKGIESQIALPASEAAAAELDVTGLTPVEQAPALEAPVESSQPSVNDDLEASPGQTREPSKPRRESAIGYLKWLRDEQGIDSPEKVGAGIHGNRTFQTGAPFVKSGMIMVDGPTGGEHFKISDLWDEMSAAGTGPALTMENYTDKSIIIRGKTRENMDRIKEAGKKIGIRALWNKKAHGWVFPKSSEAEVRESLADLVGQQEPARAEAPKGPRVIVNTLDMKKLREEQEAEKAPVVSNPGEQFESYLTWIDEQTPEKLRESTGMLDAINNDSRLNDTETSALIRVFNQKAGLSTKLRHQAPEPTSGRRSDGRSEDRRQTSAEEREQLSGEQIQELRAENTRLKKEVDTDPGTGVKSKFAYLRDRHKAKGVVQLDLTLFKGYNTLLTDDGGDIALRVFGQAMEEVAPGKGYRKGGDEFAFLTDSVEDAEAIHQRMIEAAAAIQFSMLDKDSNPVLVDGIPFTGGVGPDAEAALKARDAAKGDYDRNALPPNVRRVGQPGPEEGAVPDSGSDTEREGAGRDTAAGEAESSDSGDQGLAGFFAKAFAEGRRFSTIAEARKAAGEVLGRKIEPGTQDVKLVDEAIELGVVLRSRQIVEAGGIPQEIYGKLVVLYSNMPSLSSRTSTSIEQQAYSTPVPLAYAASRLAGITKKTTVLEPTAGNGALLIEASPKKAQVNELNSDRVAALRSQGFRVFQQDASEGGLRHAGYPVDVVIANPPFGTVKGDDGQSRRFQVNEQYSTGEIDHAISLKSLENMKDDGSAVLIVGSVNKLAKTEDARSDAYNGKSKREFYLTLYRDYNVVDHFTIAGELYEKQGAGWPVDVIVIRGRGPSQKPLPAVSPPRVYNHWRDLSEVLDARYQNAPRPARTEDRSSDRSESRPASRDGRDSGRGGDSRPDRKPVGGSEGQPADVSERPVVRESADTGRVESESGDVAEPAGGEGLARRARPAPVAGENLRQVGYQPASKSQSMGTLVPVNMQTAVQDALDKLRARVGDIDIYVAGKLGYKTKELGKYFGAEQIDAIALGIDNMERPAGFIIGDQTGIGKGRVVAAIIRYALREGRTPIFVTEKPNLYGDIYRDIVDIGGIDASGRLPKILMTNAAQTVPLDEAGTVLKTGSAAVHNELLRQMTAEGMHDGYDMVFTTYSQMQTLKGEVTPRMAFLERIGKGGIVILDESHNAGGSLQQGKDEERFKKQEMNRATFARNLSRAGHGVFYSSATYAKRPEVMDLYATTDMRLAVADINNLAAAIQKGGVPMQQVVASMLAASGQYIRRERSFDGITYNAPVVSVPRETYSGYSRALHAIQKFSEGYIKGAVKRMDKQLKAEGKSMSADGATGGAGAASTNFTSIMHNLIDQMLLSIKAEVAAERAIEAIKNGEKPVITVANTMGSFIQDYVDDMRIKPGDKVDLSFNSLLDRYLERTRRVSMRKPFMKAGDKAEKVYLTDEQLGSNGVAAFEAARELIRGLDLSAMPVSPIDHIRSRIQKAGYKIGEITGRGVTLDYRTDGSYYKIRGAKEVSIAGRRKSIADFNGGVTGAMIINQAGSTGLSLHASEKFKDQRKRRMIIAQAEKNIDTHMQMLGRVNRTGQVVVPEYDQLVADVPAEKRPAAVLSKKMASLNANTTASRGGALMAEDVPDFMNQYGDEVAARVMSDMPEIHDALGSPLADDEAGYAVPDAMRKVTGRIPLLPIDQQEMVYEVLEGEYKALIEQKEAAGESVLEAKTLDLDAKVEEKRMVVAPTKGDSPFADGVYIETVDVKRLGRPHPSAKVIEMVSESAGFKGQATVENMGQLQEAGRAATAELYRSAGRELEAYRVEALDSIESPEARKSAGAKLDGLQSRFKSLLSVGLIGSQIKLMTEAGNLYGVVTKIQRTGKAKNPIALGAWKMTVALADATRQITLPMSQLYTKYTQPNTMAQSDIVIDRATKITADMTVMEAFDRMQSKARETRTIITGNILAGFDHVRGRGAIINFTDSDGNVRQGIMMSRDFDYDEQQADLPVDFRTADQVMAFVAKGHAVHSSDEAITVTRVGDRIRLEVAASKARGGRYYLDKGILAAVGSDFVKAADKMRADVPRDQALAVIDEMKRAGAGFRAIDNLPTAREVAADAMGRDSVAPVPNKQQADGKFRLRDEFAKDVAKITGNLAARLEKLGIDANVALVMQNRIQAVVDGKASEADGRYLRGVIEIALSAEDGVHTLNHEAIHALRDLGLFRDAEWRSLEKAAKADEALVKKVRDRYKVGDEGTVLEEAIAEMYADWAAERVEPIGFVKRAFERIRDFFLSLRGALTNREYTKLEDIFAAVERGEVGQRPRDEKGQFASPDNPHYALKAGDFKPERAAPVIRGPVPSFENAQSEARWQDARKGVTGSETLLDRLKERLSNIADGFTRHFIHLPNTAQFSEAREQLRKLESAPQAAKEDAVRKLRSIVDGMTREDLDLFTRKVVLEDLSYEADVEHELPFGLTPESVKTERDKVDEALKDRPDLLKKVKIRSQIVKQLADDMVEAGVLERDRLKNPAYYRHQVLDYARAQVAYAKGAGKKLKTPKWAKRLGSRMDINANLLEAEFEWMQKALMDISVANTIEWIKKSEYNIRDSVIADGKAHNKALIDKLLAKDMEKNGYVKSSGRETSPLNEEWMGFKQRIAMGLGKVKEAIESGALTDIPREYRKVADSLANGEESEFSLFPFLTWIMDNDKPGAMGSAQTFKAISQRKAWMKAILGDQYADPMNLEDLTKRFAPEGYVTWQPDEGKLLFTAKTIPEHVIDRMLVKIAADGAGQISADELLAALHSVRSMLAVGGPKYQMVLPGELAASLNSLRDEDADGLFDALVAVPLSWWKRWVLINPRRVIKYNLNNLSGDLDAIIAGNPSVVKKLPQAIKELWHVMMKGENPSDRYREAVERGVFDSGLSVQEIPDINFLNEFESLINPPTIKEPVRFVLSPLVKFWRKLSKYTQFRENWMRYAAYLDYIERLEAGQSMQTIGYGASKREMVDAISDNKDKAALLARDLVGDYGAISHYGKGIRRKVIPFYSWMEINTKRYWRLGINAWDQGIGQGFRTTGVIGAVVGVRTTAYLTLRMAALYAVVQLWNNLLFGDEEDELSVEDRTRLHIILGRDDSGQIRSLKFQGALSDYLGWIGFSDAVGVMSDIEKGRATFGELIETILKAPVNKLLTSLTPVITVPVELLSGKTYWPDVFQPRAIQDKWRYVAKLFSTENEYDAIFDRPSRGYGRSITEAVLYKRDVGETSYNLVKGMAYDWERRETGQTGSGTYQTPRSKALYDWRLAKKYGDAKAEDSAYLRMEELGVDFNDLKTSVRNAHPLGSIPVKSRAAFLETLTADEYRKVEEAIEWYDATFLD